MMLLSALVDAAGLFDWLAAQAARLSGGSARRLFFNVFILGSLISMILSNDATALIKMVRLVVCYTLKKSRRVMLLILCGIIYLTYGW
jgi:Na+/H+ antiporter NhaD/arsenite permease-like protein